MTPCPKLHIAATKDLHAELTAIKDTLADIYAQFTAIANRLDETTAALILLTHAIQTQTPQHERN